MKILIGAGYFVVILIILVGLGALVVGVPRFFGPVPIGEIQMGLVVALAIGSLLALLTVMAAVFSRLNLANPQEALGLPTGSIRALIALFLIMIFIIMSIYLFRTISGGEGLTLTNLTAQQVAELEGRIQILKLEQNESGSFDVIPKVGVTAAAEQLALQLVTILATLVTAVSAFYFGSASTRSALSEATAAVIDEMRIENVIPSSAKTAVGTVDLEITGKGFAAGAAVKLRLAGVADINATNVTVVNASRINCKIDIRNAQTGQCDVVIVNPDGRQAGKSSLFQITQ